ncbi:MAG: ParB/RepB/Spo0J family partition protein [Patescibacteria group bacterium]|jgi:ParB family chromosome partitioning protein
MTKMQGGLGRGLGALIPQKIAPEPGSDASVVAQKAILEISPDAIIENPHQPRRYFEPEELKNLADSIKEHGILQPLVVTMLPDGTYELIAGERRLRAARSIHLPTVPVIVRNATDQQKLELALIENIQRQNLDAVEEAHAYQSLIDLFSLSHDEIGMRVGKSRSYVSNTVRLLELEPEILDALMQKKISRSHARTLLAEDDHERRMQLFAQILEGGVTVRSAEIKTQTRNPRRRVEDPNIAGLESTLREALGTKVEVSMLAGSTGKISIYFYSKEEFKTLMNRLIGS